MIRTAIFLVFILFNSMFNTMEIKDERNTKNNHQRE